MSPIAFLIAVFIFGHSDLVSSAVTVKPLSPSPLAPNTILPPLPNVTHFKPSYFWNKDEYPDPLNNPKFCRRPAASLLCDPESILTAEQATKLEHLMNQTSNVTKCYCKECPSGGHGVKVAIALVHNIFRNYNAPQNSNSQEFANHLRSKWAFGTCDNSVLILLVAANDEITLSLGAIAEKVFDDKFFASLILAHRNEFDAGRFYEGLVSIIGGMRHHMISSKAPVNLDHDGVAATRGLVAVEGGSGSSSGTRTAVAVVGIVIGFMLVIFILTGTIILAKRRFEAQQEETAIDPEVKPEGYWTTEGGKGPEEPRSDNDDDDSSPPPLPTTPPPPATPSHPLSSTTRTLSTPNGVVEYEPVSIEEEDTPQPEPQSQPIEPAIAPTRSSIDTSHLAGQEELLDQSSRISTPEAERQSRL